VRGAWRLGNWRIMFGWIEGDAVNVDLEDYH
jgi:plasmid maintenance system killer protein